MTFSRAAWNFVILMTVAFVLLIVDLVKWQSGQQTWSEAIWEVNQHSLAVAFGTGMVCGHCFTVPMFPKQIAGRGK
jgi:vancomycin permeability regulator SanA